MNQLKPICFAVLAAAMLTMPAAAVEITADPETRFTFSADDFIDAEQDTGIFLTAVPSANVASLRLGQRTLRAGDALNRSLLDQVSVETACVTPQEVSVEYRTLSNGTVSEPQVMTLSILPKKNDPPTAKDSSFETYRNIANSGTLCGEDPEDGPLTYQLVDLPKRGTVDLSEDGTFTYTPEHNKVGKDRFTFTVTDEAGNVSDPAEVTVRIKKPTDKTTYADMTQDPDAFSAVWMREQGLYAGETVGGHLCFSPDATVSRGEFLVMVMQLVDAEPVGSTMTTGFADEAATPKWLQPYLTAALRNGMITGIQSEDGIVFQASADMTKAEASVMLQNILQLPTDGVQAVFSESSEIAVPIWAAEATSALAQAGVDPELTAASDAMTRRDAAKLLYAVDQLIRSEKTASFYWVQ